ncbi:MAG: neprosin family prolyl endopeptidase [Caulobacterales bacterium]|nr:neprosin family prolyl endopeptidase [Caulobacterales bacterium]
MARKSPPKGIRPFDDFYAALKTAQPASYQERGAKVRGLEAFEEQKQHLLDLYAGIEVRHSFQDPSGQIFDCVPIAEQPALRRESLAEPPEVPGAEKAAAQKAPTQTGPLHETRLDAHGNAMSCPPGFVPLRRITLDELTRFETLSHFRRKSPRHPDRKRAPQEAPGSPEEANSGHEYAHARQAVRNLGATTMLNVWSPSVADASSTFSLSQMWVAATSPTRGVQTVEAGWQVYPTKYGHTRPVLFSYWTADAYKNTGSYSTEQHEFVQHSSTCPLGFALDHASLSHGAQAEIEVTLLFSLGNWWLFVGGSTPAHAIGYYPASLFGPGPLTTAAETVDFGGETCATELFPPMGSGAFAARGYKEAAYQRRISYFDTGRAARMADLAALQAWPAKYTIEVQRSPDWGEFFFFGGPGG